MYTIVWEINVFSGIMVLITLSSLIYTIIITVNKSKIKTSEKYFSLKSRVDQIRSLLYKMNYNLGSWSRSNKAEVMNDEHFRQRCENGIEANNTIDTRASTIITNIETEKFRYKKLLEIESDLNELKTAVDDNEEVYNAAGVIFRNKH